MKIAIIPARGGSKRIPRKNIRLFCGKPIIAWSIEAALASGCFSRVIVSTDDAEIAEVSRQHGAETPFLRPRDLANDQAGTKEVIVHAIDWLDAHAQKVESACCIYATAPFICADDLRQGWETLSTGDCDFVFSVTSFPYPIQRALRIGSDGRIEMFQPQHYSARSQDLEAAWHDAGQFYWGHASAWRTQDRLFSPASRPLVLPRHRVQDIDTPEDWTRAELMFQALNPS